MKQNRKSIHVHGKKAKKAAAKTAVTLTASAGILLGGLFPAPSDLLHGDSALSDALAPASVIEMQVNDTMDDLDPDTDSDETCETEEKKRGSWKAALRAWILHLPFAVRVGICLPLWCIGWVLLTLLSSLWSVVLSPLISTALGWIAMAAMILLCCLGIVKTAFPQLPVRKILNRKTICFALLGVVVCAGADLVLSDTWSGYETIRSYLRFAGSAAVLAGVSLPFFRKKNAKS